jgi:group I intron endonuclease
VICAVYTITDRNGGQYVGGSSHLKKRWTIHRGSLRKGTHHSKSLQAMYIRDGEHSLKYEILIECIDKDALLVWEQRALDILTPVHNTCPRADGQLGTRYGPQSIETRAKTSAALKGRKFSDSHRANLSVARIGKKASTEHRANMSRALTGKKRSAETKAKISATMMGNRNARSLILKGS